MSFKKVIIHENRYVDSVTLMGIADSAKKHGGVRLAEVQMGTPANIAVLRDLGFDIPAGTGANDLIVAIGAENTAALKQAEQNVADRLERRNAAAEASYSSLEEIDMSGNWRLCQISLPGAYAAAEAEKAIKLGMDVFIFSDNVSLEEELRLKQLGEEKDVLVMGPDCGIGLIDGVALATGSIVSRGPVGIVGASGSGAQEIACIIEKSGSGVSAIIGTGGHDLFPQIGGISMIKGMKRLDADDNTRVIVLVSKLADRQVMDKVLGEAGKLQKPVVAVFLGSDEKLFSGHKVDPAFSLEEAALKAVELVAGKHIDFGYTESEIQEIVSRETAKYTENQKYLRGIYCGGTFTEESIIYFSINNPDVTLYSNLDTKYTTRLENHLQSTGNALIDMGSEEFTLDTPHPVFDPELRLKRFREEAENPETAVILLDFITGPGVHENPISPFAQACAEAISKREGKLTVIAAICGSVNDPQNITARKRELEKAGVIVTASNNQSTKLASALLSELNAKGV